MIGGLTASSIIPFSKPRVCFRSPESSQMPSPIIPVHTSPCANMCRIEDNDTTLLFFPVSCKFTSSSSSFAIPRVGALKHFEGLPRIPSSLSCVSCHHLQRYRCRCCHLIGMVRPSWFLPTSSRRQPLRRLLVTQPAMKAHVSLDSSAM